MPTIPLTQALREIITRYERQVTNMQWHIDTNNPVGEELRITKQRIYDLQQIIKDLKQLV